MRRLREAATPSGAAAAPAAAAPARPAAAARRAGASGLSGSERPILPPGVEEVFVGDPRGGAAEAPGLFAEARVHYVAARDGVDVWEDVRVVVPFGDGDPRFEDARVLAADENVGSEPPSDARFLALPEDAVRPASYTAWGRELLGWLLRERPLRVLACAEAKLVARPGESEGDFRARLAERLREERDEAVEKLRSQYASRIEQARAREASARARAEREGSQFRGATLDTAVSVGATVLDVLFGRGRRRSLGTAARAAGRTAREHGDMGRAEDALRDAEEARAALEREAAERRGGAARPLPARGPHAHGAPGAAPEGRPLPRARRPRLGARVLESSSRGPAPRGRARPRRAAGGAQFWAGAGAGSGSSS